MFIAVTQKALDERITQQTVFSGQSKGQVKRIITQAGYDTRDFVIAKVED